MTRWLPRAFWLAAWSFWLWLGFGLHRELPRDLGPVVCRLPLGENEATIGFLGDSPTFATLQESDDGSPAKIRTWDANSGSVIRTFDGPKGGNGWGYYVAPSHGQIVSIERQSEDGRRPARNVSVLDLATGKWTDLAVYTDDGPIFSEDEPWVAFSEDAEVGKKYGQVLVFHLQTGALLFRWDPKRENHKERDIDGQTVFIGESIGVSTRRHLEREDEDDWDEALEIWPVSLHSSVAKVVRGVRLGSPTQGSRGGRVVWGTVGVRDWVDVLDLNSEEVVFRYPPGRTSSGGGSGLQPPGPSISQDGRIVCGPTTGKLWDIDGKREVWTKRKGQTFIDWDKRSRFEVQEHWTPFGYEIRLPDTFAVRDAHSGSLIFRCRGLTLGVRNSNGTLHFDWHARSIRELPPLVNYPLLALCQTILALPLILLWVIIRWRRNRRLRLAGVQA